MIQIRDEYYWINLIINECDIIINDINSANENDFRLSYTIQGSICFRIIQI